ncbi:MAG: hypothetical protein JJE39_14060 [Vicinamibacteria bacterium]|nr:hypothetical protein [Vicinamibacteria bacterium]
MTLTPGQRLGGCEVVSWFAAGGLSEVYRARDPKLDRDVAIKVLPERVAADADALARFEREPKTITALLENGADLLVKGAEGRTAFDPASRGALLRA